MCYLLFGMFGTVTSGEVDLMFSPHFQSNVHVSKLALGIDKNTKKTQKVGLLFGIKHYFRDLNLIDSDFHKARSIYILLGVNAFFYIVKW